LGEKDVEIEALRKEIKRFSAQYTAQKAQKQQNRRLNPENVSEWENCKRYIDVELELMGWYLDSVDADVLEEAAKILHIM